MDLMLSDPSKELLLAPLDSTLEHMAEIAIKGAQQEDANDEEILIAHAPADLDAARVAVAEIHEDMERASGAENLASQPPNQQIAA